MNIKFLGKKKNSNEFLNKLKNTNESNTTCRTENGAVGFYTTKSKLVDFNFLVSSFRSSSEAEIKTKFTQVYLENKHNAIVYLFYLRNVRGGLGERRVFRICFLTLCNIDRVISKKLLKFIPEFGRWDDLFYLYRKSHEDIDEAILKLSANQFYEDLEIVNKYTTYKSNEKKESISLLGKWLPSETCKVIEKVRFKDAFIKHLDITHKEYRKCLTALRAYLDVTEVKMTNKEWDKIDYSKVPSRANLMYNDAFLRNDTDRRLKYLEDVKSGKETLHTGVLFPHDIIHRYKNHYCEYLSVSIDEGLENLWKEMSKNFVINNDKNILCVCDTSYSMKRYVSSNSKILASEVAYGLSIFFSEKMKGPFKNNIMTFSTSPKLMDLSAWNTLGDKYNFLEANTINSNTNIETVFCLILKTALSNKMSQEEIPDTILIISDMEFDNAVEDNQLDKPLFDMISDKYKQYGYKLPKLVFWNVCSSSKVIPLTQNENGVLLVSGFSPNICNMVISNEFDPLKALLKELDNEVYDKIRDVLE